MSNCLAILSTKQPLWTQQFATHKKEISHLESNPFFWTFLEKYLAFCVSHSKNDLDKHGFSTIKLNEINIDDHYFNETLAKVFSAALNLNAKLITENNVITLQLTTSRVCAFNKIEFLEKGDVFSKKLSLALRQGFFYMEVPDEIKPELPAVVSFAEKLRDNEKKLKTYTLGDHEGYQVRRGTQSVAFVANRKDWPHVHSPEVQSVAIKMNKFAVEMLKEIFQFLNIPKEQWELASGGLTHGKGSHYLTVNNYQPGSENIGLIPHYDWGWITVLFINKVGLQVMIDGEWIDVMPQKDYFVINFGKAFETLTPDVKAGLHRVRKVFEERVSFGIFINHDESSWVYELKEGQLIAKQPYTEFLSERKKEIETLLDSEAKS